MMWLFCFCRLLSTENWTIHVTVSEPNLLEQTCLKFWILVSEATSTTQMCWKTSQKTRMGCWQSMHGTKEQSGFMWRMWWTMVDYFDEKQLKESRRLSMVWRVVDANSGMFVPKKPLYSKPLYFCHATSITSGGLSLAFPFKLVGPKTGKAVLSRSGASSLLLRALANMAFRSYRTNVDSWTKTWRKDLDNYELADDTHVTEHWRAKPWPKESRCCPIGCTI